jgi:hypothetical protein
MAGDLKGKLGTASTFTCTLASLANNGARQSTAIDNTSDLFDDVQVVVKVKSAGSSTSATGYVNVYAFGSVDGGTTYTESAGASDAGITLTSPTNARLIGVINVVANATTYVGGPMSVASAFGGKMPDHWGIIVENKSGAALDSTEGNHAKQYRGIYGQYT